MASSAGTHVKIISICSTSQTLGCAATDGPPVPAPPNPHSCAGSLSSGASSPATWAARTTSARPHWSTHPATSSRSRPVRRGWRPYLCHLLTRGTALELMLKLLLSRHGKDDKHIHGLVGRSLALPKEVQESLSATYRDSLQGIKYGLFAVKGKKPQEQRLKNRPISTIRKTLECFDKDVKLDRKRYSWEPAQTRQWRHCIGNP